MTAPLTPDRDGWIEWSGKGDYPKGEVMLRLRDGCEPEESYPAEVIGWLPIGDPDDIIAYRVVQP